MRVPKLVTRVSKKSRRIAEDSVVEDKLASEVHGL